MITAVTARFLLNMLANIVLQLAAEVLPTPVRAQGISLVHIFGIIAHSLAPYVIELVRNAKSKYIYKSLSNLSLTQQYY